MSPYIHTFPFTTSSNGVTIQYFIEIISHNYIIEVCNTMINSYNARSNRLALNVDNSGIILSVFTLNL